MAESENRTDRVRMSDVTANQGSGEIAPRPTMSEKRRIPGNRKEDWVGHHLRRVYDDALQEAIPSEMMALLAALDDDDKDGEGGDTPAENGTAKRE